MYTPKHFDQHDLSLAHQLMAEQPLALLVGPDGDGQSLGTHVPLGIIRDGDQDGAWLLEGHMARANPHWAWLQAQTSVLAVFSGPSAYISPARKLLNAIVGFRLKVTRWEGKFKLSQNRAAAERARIQAAFADGSAHEQSLAKWMAQLGL